MSFSTAARSSGQRELAHLWANRSRPSGRASSLYFEGDTIYSYGRHFPIARLFTDPTTGQTAVLFTSRDHSRTTSQHKSFVRSAVSHLVVYTVQDPTAEILTCGDLARHVDFAVTQKAKAAEEAHAEKLAAARRKREQARTVRNAVAAYPSELAAWRAGGRLPCICTCWGPGIPRVPVALRLTDEGRYIETTKGAKVPSSVARKVWPILRAAVAHEETHPAPAWVPFFEAPEFNWGDYRGISLRRIAAGSPVELRVGCHNIPWSEIELMAQALGLVQVHAEVAS